MADSPDNQARSKENAESYLPRPQDYAPTAPSHSAVIQQLLLRAERLVIVTKLRFMGDTIVATPFLSELRRFLPSVRTTLVTSPSAACALEHCPDVDEIVSLSIQGKGRIQQGRELYDVLRKGRFDAAFLANRSFHCAAMTLLARVPVRVGFDNEFRRPMLTLPVHYSFDRHEVDCHLDLLRALQWPATPALPNLWLTARECADAREFLQSQGWRPEQARLLIGVQPGANDAQIRAWPVDRYARVAERMAREQNGVILIMGGADECDAASALQNLLRVPCINLCGKLALRQALATIGLCNLWIGNDTGLLHAAVAQKVPTVGMFGPNKVIRWGYSTRRHRSMVVFPDKPARDDSTVRRCLEAISEEDVYNTAYDVCCVAGLMEGRNRAVAADMSDESLFYRADDARDAVTPVRRR